MARWNRLRTNWVVAQAGRQWPRGLAGNGLAGWPAMASQAGQQWPRGQASNGLAGRSAAMPVLQLDTNI
jgi:hypothetical protein